MKLHYKKAVLGTTVSTITMNHDKANKVAHQEAKALAILLGGYNEFGRSIDYGKYQEILQRFEDCIYDINEALNQ